MKNLITISIGLHEMGVRWYKHGYHWGVNKMGPGRWCLSLGKLSLRYEVYWS